MSYHYLLDLALILLSTKALGLLTQKIQMPQVVGALLAGLILGPAMLNVLSETQFLTQMSELGVIVLMFSAGMGTDIKELKSTGKAGFLVALLGVLTPLVLGAGFAWLAGKTGMMSSGSFLEDLFVGTILTATSVSITVETLKELGKLGTKVGSTILAAALIDDVMGLIALTLVSGLAGEDSDVVLVLVKIVLFFVFAALAGLAAKTFLCWMMAAEKYKDLRRYPVLSFALCLLMAYCAEEFFGVADIIGAYVAGLVISTTPKAQYIESKFQPVSYLLLTPIFFAGIGVNVQLPTMTGGLVLFSSLLLLLSILTKVLGCGLGARLCGFDAEDSLRVGAGMSCRGEVALIVANRGLALGVLSSAMMTPVIITVVGGTILTPIMLKLLYRSDTKQDLHSDALTDRIEAREQLDIVTDRLLDQDRHLRKSDR